MIITPLYHFRYNDSSGEMMALSAISFCFGILCYLFNILLYWKKCKEQNVFLLYQKLTNIYFLCLSFCVFFMKESLVVVQTVSWGLLGLAMMIIYLKSTSHDYNRIADVNHQRNIND